MSGPSRSERVASVLLRPTCCSAAASDAMGLTCVLAPAVRRARVHAPGCHTLVTLAWAAARFLIGMLPSCALPQGQPGIGFDVSCVKPASVHATAATSGACCRSHVVVVAWRGLGWRCGRWAPAVAPSGVARVVVWPWARAAHQACPLALRASLVVTELPAAHERW